MARGNPRGTLKRNREIVIDQIEGPYVVRTSSWPFSVVVTEKPYTFYALDTSISLQQLEIQYALETRYTANGRADQKEQ